MHKKRALLLDRDGVINIDHGYVGTVEKFEFLPGLFPFLRAVRDLGFRLAVVTNQGGVARGYYSADDFATVTAHMLSILKREGIDIDLTLASFEHPDGVVAPYARQSFWRKPNPGMVLEAARRLDIDPARSAMIGDHPRDLEAALRGGIGTCLWLMAEDKPVADGVTRVASYDEALASLSV